AGALVRVGGDGGGFVLHQPDAHRQLAVAAGVPDILHTAAALALVDVLQSDLVAALDLDRFGHADVLDAGAGVRRAVGAQQLRGDGTAVGREVDARSLRNVEEPNAIGG